MSRQIEVQVADKLVPLFVKPKRIKVAVGGRAGTKSYAFSDAFLRSVSEGDRVLCAREYQNSIDESVHALLCARIPELGAEGFNVTEKTISHQSGGKFIYKGLARNLESIKSLHGIKRSWIEEGQSLSQHSIEVLFPTIRDSGSEIWISANRGSSRDPFSQLILKKAEADLEKFGYYEDDDMIVVEINWYDNPWWNETLEQQRMRDYETMPRARYDHIWEGKYSDTVDNAIIQPDWFDACVDAHIKLGFQPQGIEVVAHDPADSGDDKALAYRHGSVIVDVQARDFGDVNDACDWATGYAVDVKADEFVWDADGMGLSLKRQVADSLKGKKVTITAFSGGAGVDKPDSKYEPLEGEVSKSKSNRQTFYNKRAQYYWLLRDRMFRTWLAVNRGKYISPDDLISFSSKIPDMRRLRSELCRIPRKENGAGKIQILNKVQMKQMNIESPNLGDSVMMTLAAGQLHAKQDVDCSVPEAFSAFR